MFVQPCLPSRGPATVSQLAGPSWAAAQIAPASVEPGNGGATFEVRVTARFSEEALTFGEAMGYDTVRLRDCNYVNQPGKPELPARTVRIALRSLRIGSHTLPTTGWRQNGRRVRSRSCCELEWDDQRTTSLRTGTGYWGTASGWSVVGIPATAPSGSGAPVSSPGRPASFGAMDAASAATGFGRAPSCTPSFTENT